MKPALLESNPLNEAERKELLASLDRTRMEYLASVSEVGEEGARWKPAPERWSVLECAEHVAVVEVRLLKQITDTAAPDNRFVSPGRESQILQTGADRSEKREAPEAARPTGRFASLAEAIREFEKRRADTVAHITRESRDLRALRMDHPRFGSLTAQECLALLIMHPARHAAQVREILGDARFPR